MSASAGLRTGWPLLTRALVARAREAWTNPGMPPLPLSSAEML
jgi:hypothetical protein